jgi:hypothetical protein
MKDCPKQHLNLILFIQFISVFLVYRNFFPNGEISPNLATLFSGQLVVIPMLTVWKVRTSLACVLLLCNTTARQIIKIFASEGWMFYLGTNQTIHFV